MGVIPMNDYIYGSPFRARPLPSFLAIGNSKLRYPMDPFDPQPRSRAPFTTTIMTGILDWPYKCDDDADLELAVWAMGCEKHRQKKPWPVQRRKALVKRWRSAVEAIARKHADDYGWTHWLGPRL